MIAMKRTVRTGSEQLISALIPVPLSQPAPVAAPLPVLPARRLPTDPQALPLLDLARLDRSGRLSARAMLRGLGWGPGHRVDVAVVRGALLVASALDGAYALGSRGDLALPAAARTLCGMTVAEAVVVAAYARQDLVMVYPVGAVARLVHELHVRLAARDVA
jgi:hypothetical protein